MICLTRIKIVAWYSISCLNFCYFLMMAFNGVQSTIVIFFFSSRRRHTRFDCDWSSDVCSSDLRNMPLVPPHVPPFQVFGVGLALGLWLYSGYEQVSSVAEEVQNPQRNCPIAQIGRASCRERV